MSGAARPRRSGESGPCEILIHGGAASAGGIMSETHTKIEVLQKEIFESQAKITELRRTLEPEAVGAYTFRGPDGAEVALADLFGDRDDLLVVHNMGRGCPYCTLWADGFQGAIAHLENRAAFVVVSPDDPEVQRAFAASRGWTFRMVSGGGTSFARDMGFEMLHEGKPFVLPGASAFRRQDDGSVVRTAHTPFGPGDPYCAAFHLFDLFEGGLGTRAAEARVLSGSTRGRERGLACRVYVRGRSSRAARSTTAPSSRWTGISPGVRGGSNRIRSIACVPATG